MKFIRRSSASLKRSWALLAAISMFAIPAAAAAQAVTEAYGITGSLQNGMIVMIDPKNASNVEALNNKKDQAMAGAVVSASDSAVSLSGNGTTNQVYVATAGKYDVLVSNQNGSIKNGDLITISAVDGIGMKADSSESIILGKAIEPFDGTSNVSGTTTLKTSTGTTQNVSIGLIQVDIGISHNPLAANAGADSAVPGFLRRLAMAIAGKPVSAARIYISIAILLVTIIIAGSILYGGVRSSVGAIGRNPLAKSSVLRGMFQVTSVGVIIFVLGLCGIYLLLKL